MKFKKRPTWCAESRNDVVCYINQSEEKPFFIFQPLVLTNPRTGWWRRSTIYIGNSREKESRMGIRGLRTGWWNLNRGQAFLFFMIVSAWNCSRRHFISVLSILSYSCIHGRRGGRGVQITSSDMEGVLGLRVRWRLSGNWPSLRRVAWLGREERQICFD